MDKQFIGCTVSVDCGDNGTYQGEVNSINNETLVLKKAFKNGIPHNETFAVIRSHIIKDLQIIKTAEDAVEKNKNITSTVTVRKPIAKRINRTVSESIVGNKLLHANHDNNVNPIYSNGCTNENNCSSNVSNQHFSIPHSSSANNQSESPWKSFSNDNRALNLNHPVVFSEVNRTPNKKDRMKHKWNVRDEACFGEPIKDILHEDFDFEKNLALFNKQAVYDEINAQRPDLVRQTDKQVNYRHDEHVIRRSPAQFRQISVPSHYSQRNYVTDDGQVVPTIPSELRRLLLNLSEDYGYSFARYSEIMGRSTAEITIQLLGGARRLNHRNSHQKPRVVVMCGSNRPGAIGLATARILAGHGIKMFVYLTESSCTTVQVTQELHLYKITGERYTNKIQDLPTGAVDLIIMALADEHTTHINSSATSWVVNCRAPIIAIDPPPTGTPGIAVKLSIVPILPLAHCRENGQIYLVNLAVPLKIFSEVGITYRTPFGPKLVIPLHPDD